ncbi:MAG: ABC transporter permease [Deinococcota bacterium]|jgi:peptide/nickel transport system permease protein|nr:ABC transporter permease [Deinococcota bacterium]
MVTYTLRRLTQMIPLLFLASVVIFSLVSLQPGDPLDELRMNNPLMTQEQYQGLRRAYGLDQPIYVRYFRWLGRAVQGDLGISRTFGRPAATFIFTERLPRTLLLTVTSLVIALLIAIPVGIFVAVRQYSSADYTVTFLSFLGLSTPNFFLGIILLYLFVIYLPETIGLSQLPVGGLPNVSWADIERGRITVGEFFGQWARYMVLPVITLATGSIAGWTRFMRASMLEVLNQDFIRTARSKGLHEQVVLYKHALRNGLIPIVTLVGLSLPSLFNGALITETIFSFPGMGRAIFESLLQKDYNVAMAALIFLAILTVTFNLLADLMYAVIDPRIRYD